MHEVLLLLHINTPDALHFGCDLLHTYAVLAQSVKAAGYTVCKSNCNCQWLQPCEL